MPTIGGVNLTWDETSPPVTESAGLGAGRIESVKSTTRTGLEAEHVWPSGGGNNVGAHVMGSARPFFGPQSNVSSTGSDARLMITSDTSRLFGVGSSGTLLLGAGPTALSLGSLAALSFPQRSYIAMEVGQGITGSTGSTLITIPNSGFSGVPFIQVTSIASVQGVAFVVQAVPVDGATFVVNSFNFGGSFTSAQSFHWQSTGTRTL